MKKFEAVSIGVNVLIVARRVTTFVTPMADANSASDIVTCVVADASAYIATLVGFTPVLIMVLCKVSHSKTRLRSPVNKKGI